ncbi:MAG: 2-C-methyl-D-erythritol 2,4-cyclodiphosphate synthase [Gemmatimonadales bacterium]|nr:MAG: 2-C-methyl-D-erythritol 2,4-cyclodiphosphate synthase [Gemmatimonadales bacterium]
MRVGTGYDSHRFSASRPLVLGGIRIPDVPGLTGHSDGDAILHAVTDALLGAASLGSIGERFPDDDPTYAGVDSAMLLEDAVGGVIEAGFHVVNVDITVIAEFPRIQQYSRSMEERIAGLLGVSAGDVSVKGKTNEGMGWIGREEGLAVIAAVLIDENNDLEAPDVSHRVR